MSIASIVLADAGGMPGWMTYFKVEQPWEAWWLLLGLVAQTVFFARWVIQWIASERRGESVMPTLFWWVSLVGATMTLVYYVGRHEPIGILSQTVGWTIYSRNLYLIRLGRRNAASKSRGVP
jgi:lipid-A-disaccharide synthase-like uncharacterized protein